MMRLKHWYRLGFSALLAAAATACAANGPTGEGSESDEPAVDEAQAASGADADAKGKHRGQDKMFRLALDELDLTAAQRATIEGLAADATEDHAAMKGLMSALDAMLEGLQPLDRAALVLVSVEGLTAKEAAAALECTEGALEQRLVRARAAIRRAKTEQEAQSE